MTVRFPHSTRVDRLLRDVACCSYRPHRARSGNRETFALQSHAGQEAVQSRALSPVRTPSPYARTIVWTRARQRFDTRSADAPPLSSTGPANGETVMLTHNAQPIKHRHRGRGEPDPQEFTGMLVRYRVMLPVTGDMRVVCKPSLRSTQPQ